MASTKSRTGRRRRSSPPPQTSCSPPAKITKYYTAFGRVIATRVNGVLSYNLADHLGSTVQQIDSMNTPGPAIKYFPFGAPRNGTTSPERAFTGQQREDDSPLGMYYYHARFYSSVLGHFMSADSVPAGLNRYAYTGGNPLRYTDPTGHCFLDLSCSWQDAQNWLKCALSCGDNWLGDLSRSALTQDSFWKNFANAFATSDDPTIAKMGLFETIATNATLSTLHVLFANQLGGNYLASLFGAGARAAYFEASLGDVLFGTDRVSQLSLDDVMGATPWTDGEFGADVILRGASGQSGISYDVLARFSSVPHNLATVTITRGGEYQSAGGDLNQLGFSQWQQAMMHGNGLNVNVDEEETSRFQLLGDAIVGCATDPTCVSGTRWASEFEVNWYHP